MRARRTALNSEQRARHREAAVARVLADPAYQSAQVVCCYASFGDELDTSSLRAAVLASDKTLLLPRVESRTTISLRVVKAEDVLAPNRLGIMEPLATAPRLPVDEVDLFVVPGLAFDAQGQRLGYGGGYYDRLLTQARPNACLMGLAFSIQILPQVPQDPFDVCMTVVVTEAKTLRPAL